MSLSMAIVFVLALGIGAGAAFYWAGKLVDKVCPVDGED